MILLGPALVWLGSCGSNNTPQLADLVCRDCNVILISVDTLRADRLSLYGYERPTSPYLEELGGESVVFDRFMHSGGGTLPSHMTMLTSLNPVSHGIDPKHQSRLPDARVTLAEQLRDAGFSTAAFTDAGWVKRKFGFDQGFDLWDEQGGRFAGILPRVFDWLDGHHQEQFFLFVHSYEVHSAWERLPYDCSAETNALYTGGYAGDFDGCLDGECASRLLASINDKIRKGQIELSDVLGTAELKFMSDLYDGCIHQADARLAGVVQKLRDLGIYDKTLLIVTSDHGEEFGEHGMLMHDQGGYSELAHIPLIMKLPHSKLGGTRVRHLVAMVDLMPTILEILEVPVDPQAQGRSLAPTFVSNQPIHRAIHMYDVLMNDRWKFLRGSRELYDLEADPGERVNLYDEKPDVVEEVGEDLKRLVKVDERLHEQFMHEADETAIELTDEERQKLEALGYLN